MRYNITRFNLENELDIVLAYKRAMKIAESCSLLISEQTLFATAVSEISRNALEHATDGVIEFYIDRGKPLFLQAEIRDSGPGFSNVEEVMSGRYNPSNNRGRGLLRTKKIVDRFVIDTGKQGTRVNLGVKLHPQVRINIEQIISWTEFFKNEKPISPYDELKKKNIHLYALSEQLKESEVQYRILSESAPMMVFTLDGEGTTTYINRWTRKYCGFSCAELAQIGWSSVIHPDDHTPYLEKMEESRQDGAPLEMEYRLKHKSSNEYKWHLFRLAPYKDDFGVIIKWVGFNIDIEAHKALEATLRDNTFLKQLQTKLEDKIQELHISNSELEKFAFVASHDLQEPLRKIATFSDRLLNNHQLETAEHNLLRKMNESALRMKRLIEGLLNFSTLGKKIIYMPLSLNPIINDVILELQPDLDARSPRIEVEPDLPMINGNKMQVMQLFMNLLSNSIKYGNVADPLIQIRSVPAEQGFCKIMVKDNGIGFDEKYLDKIFEIFQRLHLHHEYEGTGIGLAICKKIMQNHQGSISATSRLGEGAEFVLTFPVHQNFANHEEDLSPV